MRICFFGIYDPKYSRNDILLSGLRQLGVEVVECRADWRDPKRYLKLWRALKLLNNNYDFIYAAYPSPVPTILAKLISTKPVVCDAFYSMFDSVVNDRRKFHRFGYRALKLLFLDWISVLVADVVITDTEEHRKYWSSWLFVPTAKIHTVHLGINDNVIFPIERVTPRVGILVHFHGTYIPLQGALKIVEAARILSDEGRIKFRMIGNGREYPKATELAAKHNLTNIEFVGNVPIDELNRMMNESDIALGIFGDTAKARRVIPNKVYEGLAAGKPMITMDTPAIREIFTPDEIMMVEGTPEAIAEAIRELAHDEEKRTMLSKNGYARMHLYQPSSVAGRLAEILERYKS